MSPLKFGQEYRREGMEDFENRNIQPDQQTGHEGSVCGRRYHPSP